jgi:uncharacterized NAD(P)/FAD-binding protein YdhS
VWLLENRQPRPPWGVLWPYLSKVQSVDQRMRLECGIGFRQLRTCRRKGGSRRSHSIAAPDVSDELIRYYRERDTGERAGVAVAP